MVDADMKITLVQLLERWKEIGRQYSEPAKKKEKDKDTFIPIDWNPDSKLSAFAKAMTDLIELSRRAHYGRSE
jgi:hypothetical protein